MRVYDIAFKNTDKITLFATIIIVVLFLIITTSLPFFFKIGMPMYIYYPTFILFSKSILMVGFLFAADDFATRSNFISPANVFKYLFWTLVPVNHHCHDTDIIKLDKHIIIKINDEKYYAFKHENQAMAFKLYI